MKILFVISSLTSGGAERVLSTLANHWSKSGWEISIFVLENKNSFYPLEPDVSVHSSKKYYKSTLFTYIRQLHDIRKTIQKTEPEMIISFLNVMNISTLISSIGLKIPIIISERNNYDTLKSNFWKKLRNITYPRTTGMVVQSTYDYNKYKNVANRIIIHNPLDKNILLDVQEENKEKYIIAVGSLTRQKGFDNLIRAIHGIDLNGWKVLIIGEGVLRKSLTQLIEKYELQDHVSLIGRKSNIFDYYKKAAIFILSSRYEGFPNVLNEAMAHGCASIAFNCKTGPSDMIKHETNGLLVKDQDVNELQRNIIKLIHDTPLRKKFFKESLKIREKNDLEKISTQWKKYILHTKEGYA